MRILLSCGVLIFVLSAVFPQPRQTPNVLVIIGDDMGIDPFLLYGLNTRTAVTPTLDSLAAAGLLFENAWAYPACSPTRAAMLSGLYGAKTGVR